ncbi:MAG TPA: M20/M25/M40 family metallo-hydrolase, partial [Vicinamibacteria bacterium]|nr:M20/M25/M40 family metallo-hydrolase [Vicinamibacteria bacterium]
MVLLLGVVLAAAIDGETALRHASALAALGPHPWGSTRNEAAALYVAAQMRNAGLDAVELQRFERGGTVGTNVVGTLRGRGGELIVLGAHHDTVPGSPGAYDDAAGVGLLLEVARALAATPSRERTVVLASFDGEEAWASGKGTTTGSRAFLEHIGPRARDLVAAFVIEMSGWKGGTPVLHPIQYGDPRRPGLAVITPGWLVAAALSGSRRAGATLGVGDPYLSWLYQPAVRTFRVRLYGDDLSFLQAGRPALFASDSSFSAFYPDYHRATDTAERLDAAALSRMGRGVLGVARALDTVPRGPAEQPQWFAA